MDCLHEWMTNLLEARRDSPSGWRLPVPDSGWLIKLTADSSWLSCEVCVSEHLHKSEPKFRAHILMPHGFCTAFTVASEVPKLMAVLIQLPV